MLDLSNIFGRKNTDKNGNKTNIQSGIVAGGDIAGGNITKSGSTMRINRVVTNGSVVISNNRIFIDGEEVAVGEEKNIIINISGDVQKLEVDCCNFVSITGNAGTARTTSGTIQVEQNVDGDVETVSGDVEIGGSVNGSVSTTSGDVEAGTIQGGCSTVSGDINT
jgi:hypothetical protein